MTLDQESDGCEDVRRARASRALETEMENVVSDYASRMQMQTAREIKMDHEWKMWR